MIRVVKFGGSSVANCAQFEKVKNIVLANDKRRIVVVSAPGKRFSGDNKITDLLYLLSSHIKYGVDHSSLLTKIYDRYEDIRSGLNINLDLKAEFEFYVNRWNAINEAGGCSVIDPRFESGEDGREWLENMVKTGLITIQECVKGEWSDTSVATSTNGNFLIEQEDEKGLKKAEAEYEHELDLIDRKESKMDNELAKLETERTAITTEMDSLKTVKDDNIERTFGIFG